MIRIFLNWHSPVHHTTNWILFIYFASSWQQESRSMARVPSLLHDGYVVPMRVYFFSISNQTRFTSHSSARQRYAKWRKGGKTVNNMWTLDWHWMRDDSTEFVSEWKCRAIGTFPCWHHYPTATDAPLGLLCTVLLGATHDRRERPRPMIDEMSSC